MNVQVSALVFLFLTFGYFTGQSQINITTLADVQYGKLPNESADPFPSFYDRTEIDFRKKGFSIGTTLEQYYTTFEGRSYFDLSQLSLGYKKKKWDIKLGNFYETLGRGILLRSFEFPGAVIEDIGFRSRNYFHRDVFGASVKYRTKKLTIQALRADVLNNVLPPTFSRDERRIDIVSAFSLAYKYVKGHEAGFTFMNREQDNGNTQNYLNGILKGKIISGLDYYGEYARNIDEDDYALYSGLTGYVGNFGFSLEYKKYNNFVLGAGINEPPAAVKQQTYRVLNRSIHVSNPTNEEGYQVDLFYNFNDGTVVNFNHSLAVNIFGNTKFSFRQYFLEVQSTIGENIDYKLFLDYSLDPFKGEDNRFSLGLYTDIGVNEKIRFLPELEYQTFERNGSNVYNFNALIGVNINSKIFIAALGELTNDPFLINEGSSTKLYLGNTIRYKYSNQHTLQLFLGERRGGPQCSAGVCYEILDFRGVELRWIGKFRVK